MLVAADVRSGEVSCAAPGQHVWAQKGEALLPLPQGTFISWDPAREPGYRNISTHEFTLGPAARASLPGHDPKLEVHHSVDPDVQGHDEPEFCRDVGPYQADASLMCTQLPQQHADVLLLTRAAHCSCLRVLT